MVNFLTFIWAVDGSQILCVHISVPFVHDEREATFEHFRSYANIKIIVAYNTEVDWSGPWLTRVQSMWVNCVFSKVIVGFDCQQWRMWFNP